MFEKIKSSKMFKKYKLAKKKKIQKEKEKPKVGTLKVDKTHTAIREEVESILLLLDTRPSSAFRRIISLDLNVLNKNIFLITKKVLQIFLEEGFDLKILNKLNSCDNSTAIHNLLYDYLRVAILSGYSYKPLLNFMIRNCSFVLRKNKEELLKMIEDYDCRSKIESLKDKVLRVGFEDTVIFYNYEFKKQ